MPRRANVARQQPAVTPTPELTEPYDKYLYAELRHEVSLRQIRVQRRGPQRVTTRAGFIATLQDWDKAHNQPKLGKPKTVAKSPAKPMAASGRTVRARRGCRFRLVNVLLSPDFNGRWGEMVTSGEQELTKLWEDVHTAFMAQNSMLDTLHFQDALFVNVTPNVILAHTAPRLMQMWTEIVTMYRNAVAQAREASNKGDSARSFFDFCAGRLDLLYLHMAMLLEPKLAEFLLGDTIPASDPFGRSKGKAASTSNAKATRQTDTKPAATLSAALTRTPNKSAVAKVKIIVNPKPKLPAGLTQNPEMREVPIPAGVNLKSSVMSASKKAPAKTTAKTKQAKLAANPRIAVANGNPAVPLKKPRGKAAAAAGKTKPPSNVKLASEVKQAAPPCTTKIEIKPRPPPKQIAGGNASEISIPAETKTSPNGKRRRGEDSTTAIVEVPSVCNEIVPHPSKRVTTITTAVTPRASDLMLPPDEWDILESRLRKVNENIDRCHRALSCVETNVSDEYKQTLESDLRFYSAIKQRLQEQLLVVMQSGY